MSEANVTSRARLILQQPYQRRWLGAESRRRQSMAGIGNRWKRNALVLEGQAWYAAARRRSSFALQNFLAPVNFVHPACRAEPGRLS